MAPKEEKLELAYNLLKPMADKYTPAYYLYEIRIDGEADGSCEAYCENCISLKHLLKSI